MKKFVLLYAFLMLLSPTEVFGQSLCVFLSSGDKKISMPSVDSISFSLDNAFCFSNESIKNLSETSFTSSCKVLSHCNVKTFSEKPEVGICFSDISFNPTLSDGYIFLGDSLGIYDFTLKGLEMGTTYYYRPFIKVFGKVYYDDEACNLTTLGTCSNKYRVVNGHKFVDLGLPSGLLWAVKNIGAATEAEDGYYYAWGETLPKKIYDWSTYEYGNSVEELSKYNINDGKITLESSDDAAYTQWGAPCRMPTYDEFCELKNADNCEWSWIEKEKVSGEYIQGYKITSKRNGQSLFLPASGYYGYGGNKGLNDYGYNGYYWTSTLSQSKDFAYNMGIYRGYYDWLNGYRYSGQCIRPVTESCFSQVEIPNKTSAQIKMYVWKSYGELVAFDIDDIDYVTFFSTSTDKEIINGHSFVDLGLPSGTLWAETNIGADVAEAKGYHFAWAEFLPKEIYSWSTYNYGTIDKLTKYNSEDNKTILDLSDDVASVIWGGCRVPKVADFEELLDPKNCTWSHITKNISSAYVVDGYEVVSVRNGNSIFFPLAGEREGNEVYKEGTRGYYWTSNLKINDENRSHYLYLNTSVGLANFPRYCGLSVRPVANRYEKTK